MRCEPEAADDEHVLAAYVAGQRGPTLIIVAGLHGNEHAGVEALVEVQRTLDLIGPELSGRVYLIRGNTRALDKGVRFIDTDLNRAWTRGNLASVGRPDLLALSEGRELTELDQLLDGIMVTACGELFVLDLHSTSATGAPFATVGDTLRNRAFARKFPVPILLGVEEQLDGTMLEYLNNLGAVTLGFEGGSHRSPSTIKNHIAMIRLALANSGVLSVDKIPDLATHLRRLAANVGGPRIFEVRYREAITEEERFVMKPGFNNFDPVAKGQVLAHSRAGAIIAPETGVVLMPLYQRLGEDGFFIGREVSPLWLRLSGLLRRMRVQNIVHWLPGVRRDPNDRETLRIDTRIAKWFPLQIFHLLGFRKRRWADHRLVVSRRRHDVTSPFAGGSYGG